MSDMGSYSYVYLISKLRFLSGGFDTEREEVMVVDNETIAVNETQKLNNGDDAKSFPFWEYRMQAVPFKHHN